MKPAVVSSITVRQVEDEELSYVLQTHNEIFYPEAYNMKFLRAHYMRWPDLFLVAELDAVAGIVGFVIARIESDWAGYFATGHIVSIAVFNNYRNRGIGNRLLEVIHDRLFQKYRAISCTLHVRVDNHPALHLYQEKFGYAVIRRKRNYYATQGVDAFLMKAQFKNEDSEVFCCPVS